MRCSALQCVAVCCSVSQCVAVCCSVLQCVAVCCSVLQCRKCVVCLCHLYVSCVYHLSLYYTGHSRTLPHEIGLFYKRDMCVCVMRMCHAYVSCVCVSVCVMFVSALCVKRGYTHMTHTPKQLYIALSLVCVMCVSPLSLLHRALLYIAP